MRRGVETRQRDCQGRVIGWLKKRLRELKIKKNYLQAYSYQVHLQEVSVSTGCEQSHLFKKVWRRPIGTPFSET